MGKDLIRPPKPVVKSDEELSDAEKREIKSLGINVGDENENEFSKMITDCVAFWKSTEWKQKKKDKETGVIYETRTSPSSQKNAIRFTSSIPNCTCGALEALLFDDPDQVDDPKKSNIYKYDKLLQMQYNCDALGPNIMVNKTIYKTPVWGVSPRQMVIYLNYAVLLNPKQQETLGVRPKTSSGSDDNLNVVMQCGIEYTGNSELAKADKGYERGHTYIYFILGQEEKDGSLTFTLCLDIDPAGSIPKAFADTANSEQFKKAITMHKLLIELAKDEKNKAHRIKTYENKRLFSPII